MNAYEFLNSCPLTDLQTVGWLAGIKSPAYFRKSELIKWIVKLLCEDAPQERIREWARPDGITDESIKNCAAVFEKAKELSKLNPACSNGVDGGQENVRTEPENNEQSNETFVAAAADTHKQDVDECLRALKEAAGTEDSKKLIFMLIDKLF